MEEDAIRGRPSYVWRFGQQRRLELVRQSVRLENARIIDIGCGVGMYLEAFLRFSSSVFGTEIEFDRAIESRRIAPCVAVAAAELLPFKDNSFDVAFLHEVIEHVSDDRQTIRETFRIVRPGGHIVIFAPNRLYPFETHGVYWKERYVFGNIPLVNYLPSRLRNKLAHHVRAYTVCDIKRLFDGLKIEFKIFTQVYPGFDKLALRSGVASDAFRRILYYAETTPLKMFGLSHFVVAQVQKSE